MSKVKGAVDWDGISHQRWRSNAPFFSFIFFYELWILLKQGKVKQLGTRDVALLYPHIDIFLISMGHLYDLPQWDDNGKGETKVCHLSKTGEVYEPQISCTISFLSIGKQGTSRSMHFWHFNISHGTKWQWGGGGVTSYGLVSFCHRALTHM